MIKTCLNYYLDKDQTSNRVIKLQQWSCILNNFQKLGRIILEMPTNPSSFGIPKKSELNQQTDNKNIPWEHGNEAYIPKHHWHSTQRKHLWDPMTEPSASPRPHDKSNAQQQPNQSFSLHQESQESSVPRNSLPNCQKNATIKSLRITKRLTARSRI